MGSKITISRFVGLVFLVAALTGGTANAMSVGGSTPQGLKADGLRLQGLADRYGQMRGYTQAGLRADGLRGLAGLAGRGVSERGRLDIRPERRTAATVVYLDEGSR